MNIQETDRPIKSLQFKQKPPTMNTEKKKLPKISEDIKKGLITVGDGLENAMVDVNDIQAMYYDIPKDPHKIKLQIAFKNKEKFFLLDEIAIEFVNKYNQFLAR